MSELPLYRLYTPEIRKVSKFPGRRAGELYLTGREVGRTALRTLCLRRTRTTQVGPTPLSAWWIRLGGILRFAERSGGDVRKAGADRSRNSMFEARIGL